MDEVTRYFKRYTEDGIWHYYKLLTKRVPAGRELIKLTHPRALIDFSEYNPDLPAHRALLGAYERMGESITATEYQQAYQRAVGADFDLYLNGQLVSTDDR